MRAVGMIGLDRPVLMSAHPYGKDNVPKRRGRGWRVSVQYRMLRQTGQVRFSSLTGWEAPDPVWWAVQDMRWSTAICAAPAPRRGTASLLSAQEGEDVHGPDRVGRGAAVEHRRRAGGARYRGRKSSSSRLIASGASSCIQWPGPSTRS